MAGLLAHNIRKRHPSRFRATTWGEHPVIVPLGGFKAVELNAVGWTAALAPTAAIGGCLGYLVSRSGAGVAAGAAFGAFVGFAAARLLDARHDRRRWSNVPVKNSEDATALLRAAGLPAAPGESVIDGKPFHYVTVLARDDLAARALVGRAEVSVRSRRRARQARAKALTQPKNPPAR